MTTYSTRVSYRFSTLSPDECLWKAFKVLQRGNDDLLVCLDYVLALLFLRSLEDQNGDVSSVTSSPSHSSRRFVNPPEGTFAELYEQRKGEGLGLRINRALAGLEAANPSRLAKLFTGLSFDSVLSSGPKQAQERERGLEQVIELLHEFRTDLSSVSEAADRLRARVGALKGQGGGEVYTSAAVSSLMAALLRPVPGEHICDPVCGAGDVLVALAQAGGGTALYGQEADSPALRRGRLNLLLHGFDNAQLIEGDVLRDPRLLDGASLRRFDVVAARLPFKSHTWGEERADEDPFNRFKWGIPPATKRDFAFIAHVLETTREGHGRAAVVVTQGALYRAGTEGRIRRRLIEDNLLDAVIGLPEDIFPSAGPTAILLFRKSRQTTDVLFMGASTDESSPHMTSAQQEDLVAAYRRYETASPWVRRVSGTTIKENGFNLNLPRYLDDHPAERAMDILPTLQTIARLEAEQADLTEKFNALLRAMGVRKDH